jgi:hypothetical protein
VASAAINSPGIQLIRRTANELTLFVDEDVRAAIPGCERGLRAWEEIGYRGEEDKITLSPKAPSTEGAEGGTGGSGRKAGRKSRPVIPGH